MRYHSEKSTTNITLKINQRTGLRVSGVTSQQVEKGALLATTNLERRAFFTYSSLVMAVATAFLVPISAFLMVLYLSILGPNMGVVLCMPFWVTIFIERCLDRKVLQCNPDKELVVFSQKELLFCFLKAGLLSTVLMGFCISAT